jgi:hypothetical protein
MTMRVPLVGPPCLGTHKLLVSLATWYFLAACTSQASLERHSSMRIWVGDRLVMTFLLRKHHCRAAMARNQVGNHATPPATGDPRRAAQCRAHALIAISERKDSAILACLRRLGAAQSGADGFPQGRSEGYSFLLVLIT